MADDILRDDQPWAWPEAEWRRRVNQVRAGRSLRPPSWPGGTRCAVALSFDSDHDTNELRDGGRSISGRVAHGGRWYWLRGILKIREELRGIYARREYCLILDQSIY